MTARLAPADVLRLGAVGLRARPLRAVLSALGVAIGIAAMLSVVGISGSGRADLRETLDALGTNLLTVSGGERPLPAGAVGMIERIGPVTGAAALRKLPDGVHVYRSDRVPAQRTNGIVPYAADLDLAAILGATVARGTWLTPAGADFPTVVLGAESARRLGVTAPDPRTVLSIGGEGFAVAGILAPLTLLPELDSAAFVGAPAATRYLGVPAGGPDTIYVRAADERVTAVYGVLAATANPAAPYEVGVSRPSDALAARLATERAFDAVLLGLGAVALLVGGIGVANTMVITVLERRSEIGLRRALGATRGQIRLQFLVEAALLATLGGAGGVVVGGLVTAGYALSRDWPVALPAWSLAAALAVTVTVGAAAGLYPAVRASRLAPTQALAAV